MRHPPNMRISLKFFSSYQGSKIRFGFLSLAALIGFSLISSSSYASGLDLIMYYGTRSTGLGGAALATATDGYAPFYNPAAMTKIDKGVSAINFVPLFNRYKAPMGANNAEKTGDWYFGPLFYMGGAYKLGDRWAVGLAAYPTALQGGKFDHQNFGPVTDKEYSVRLVRLIIGPSVAFKINDYVSVGASYHIGYNQYKKQVGVNNPLNPAQSIHLSSKVSQWDFKGAKISAHFGKYKGLSGAIAYRIPVKLKMKGSTTVTTGLGPAKFDTTQSITMPGQFEASLAYEWVPDTFLTHFAYQYTFNSVLKKDEATLKGSQAVLGAGFAGDRVSRRLGYKDGQTFHMGAEYTFHPSNKDRVRVGAGTGIDLAFTTENLSSPVLQPANVGVIYGLGTSWARGNHEFGLGATYYDNSKKVSTLDASINQSQSYAGKYTGQTVTGVIDYQMKF